MLRAGGTMDKLKVAVIGAGPTGLAMLKTLKEDGFAPTLYERRSQVGGLWAYTENPSWTTALKSTQANISKYTCGFSDFPMPDKYPHHMNVYEFQEYMEDYARNFDGLKDCVFNTSVKDIRRNADDTRWVVELEQEGKISTAEYDKVAVCNGYQTKAKIPKFEGQELFEGQITHGQQFRDPGPFKDKKVVVVGLCSTSGDIIPTLMPVASKVYVSHRRGAVFVRRFLNGTPAHLPLTWRRRNLGMSMQRYLPTLTRLGGNFGIQFLSRKMLGGKPDPSWGLEPYPSPSLTLPGVWERCLPFLQDGSLTSLKGVKRFTGPKSIEFADGTVVDDVDVVILATGYQADYSLLGPETVERSKPDLDWYEGPEMYRLWMNLFPPKYADSLAVINYSAFGKANGFSFADVTSMAICNAWRGVEPFPKRDAMEAHIDEHQRWVAGRWRMEPNTDTSAVKTWEFQNWLHQAAGTGMESLGWGWAGWKFWWQDPEMYKLMNDGVETAHMYRYFETGKRKTWDGAREAIIHVNEVVKKTFPLEETK